MTIAREQEKHGMRPNLAKLPFLALALSLLATALAPTPVSATWSIIAVDTESGWVFIASATCVPQAALRRFPSRGLMDVQAVVVPGLGVAAAQAGVDRSRANQTLIYEEIRKGTDPDRILELLAEDPDFQRRQFGIVDLGGRSAGFSGSENQPASLAVQGAIRGTGIHFAIQGNILASDAVVLDAVAAFRAEESGTVLDRIMAAMEAADAAGGDVRCTCETEPLPDATCDSKNAHVAYLLGAAPDDPSGESYNDGDYSVYINVTDEDIRPHENANPVMTLRMRYDAWKEAEGG